MNLNTGNNPELDAQLTNLLQRCAASDAQALEDLYRRVSSTLFACLTRMLRRRSVAEEALQDVFITIWQRARQYQPERGRPMAWLISIARYRAIDVLRRERLTPLAVAEPPPETIVADEALENPTEEAASRPRTGLLERCLELLTQQQRRCHELAFLGGRSHADIARVLESPLGTVKSWIRRGLQSLRTCLES